MTSLGVHGELCGTQREQPTTLHYDCTGMDRTADAPPARSPTWMRGWLIAAAVYNILWGAAVIIAPVATLRLLGVTPSSADVWPALWGCIGMMVAVYGVGYAIAARDPFTHWPIVLVGLLGKTFGPVGFVMAASRGELPWSMGWTLLSNDLVWWVPFGKMLWSVRRRVAQLNESEHRHH